MPHLRQSLERGFARVRDLSRMGRGGKVAVREAGVIVAWPDYAIEVDFNQHQRGTVQTVSPTASPSAA